MSENGQEQVTQETGTQEASTPASRDEQRAKLRAAAMAAFESDDSSEATEAKADVKPPAEPKAETKPPAESEKQDSSLTRLMKKERELLEKEKAIKEQTAKFAEFEARSKEIEKKAAEFERFKRMAQTDPVGFLRAAGVEDIGTAARLLVAEDMGDSAPEDFRKLREKSEYSREFAELKRELEELKAAREQEVRQRETYEQERTRERFVEEYKSKLYTGVESSKFDYVKSLWENNRDGAKSALFQAAQRLAQARLDEGNDEPPTNAEVYEALERELSQYATWLNPKRGAGTKTLESTLDAGPPSSKTQESLSREELRKRAYAEFLDSQRES